MFKNIVLLHKEDLEEELFNKIEEIKKNFPEANFSVIDYTSMNRDILEDKDLVITLGGDGTFTRAAHIVHSSLILGINSNPKKSEGALTSITIGEIGKLKELARGNFKIIIRERADVIINGRLLDEKALNEVYIGAFSQFHSSRYKINFKGKKEEQRSSGVIVSTGTTDPKLGFCLQEENHFTIQIKS